MADDEKLQPLFKAGDRVTISGLGPPFKDPHECVVLPMRDEGDIIGRWDIWWGEHPMNVTIEPRRETLLERIRFWWVGRYWRLRGDLAWDIDKIADGVGWLSRRLYELSWRVQG